jgi:flagellar biosynthesis/type III secretory pathway protein FliH
MTYRASPDIQGVIRREDLPMWAQTRRSLEMMEECLQAAHAKAIAQMRLDLKAHAAALERQRHMAIEALVQQSAVIYGQQRESAVAAWHAELLSVFGKSLSELGSVKLNLLELMLEALDLLLGRIDRTALYERALQCLDETLEKSVSLRWYLNPEDMPIAEEARKKWQTIHSWPGEGMSMFNDASLSRGSCRFASDAGEITFGVDTLRTALLSASGSPLASSVKAGDAA